MGTAESKPVGDGVAAAGSANASGTVGKNLAGTSPNDGENLHQNASRGPSSQVADDDGATGSTEPSSSGGSRAGRDGTPSHMAMMSGGHPQEVRSSAGSSSHVADETVRVNLAMADLMAYLQVVANNSQNLPLTRRDDPELGRTVSTLTAEEYARKSAAFIPSDVRILGGTFTKYGRVWDLPTSEEYNPVDGAQEPGLSSGGACTNAMLKVLYDTDSEAADAMAQSALVNPDKLFDDDESCTTGLGMPSKSFDMSLTDMATASTITWAEMLRKMKVEMQANGYAQVPTISSSRKFDLSKPFSLVPPDFDPEKNKKRSLLIGCNYIGMLGAELKANHDDIRSVKDFIVNVHGFSEEKGLMTILLDDNEHKSPTHMNIVESFKALSEQSQPGDAVFIQFSGHGCRVLDSAVDTEAEGYDEAIIPSDFHTSGMIRDTLLFKTLLAPMRYGVTVTCVFDSCDTGVMMDLPYAWTTRNDRPEAVPKMSLNDDFSFVRFLKVVKTLYETSTFTQLGNAVGSALHHKPNLEDGNKGGESFDEDTVEVGSLMTMDENNETVAGEEIKGGNFMSSFAACIVTPTTANPRTQPKLSAALSGDSVDGEKKSRGERNSSAYKSTSIFQKVLNCTLAHDGDESDEERVFRHTNTLDDTLGDDHSFDHTLEQSLSGHSNTYDTWDDASDRGASPSRGRGRSRTMR